MTQTIEQLAARVRELEEENARLKSLATTKGTMGLLADQLKQLAASQAYAEQLLEALEKLATIANQYAGHYPYQVATIVDAALSLPADTSALDAYVAAKVKEAGKFDMCSHRRVLSPFINSIACYA